MATSSRPDGLPDLAFKITGMMCQQNCAATVQRAISTVKNVEFVEVSFPNEEALVWGTAAVVSDIISEVEDMGYEAELKHNGGHVGVTSAEAGSPILPSTPGKNAHENSPDVVLNIKGMFDSTTCPAKINSIISVLDGVFNVAIDFEAKKCSVWGFADVDVIIEALAAEGYGAKNANTATPHKKKVNKISSMSESAENRIVLNLDKLLRVVSLQTAENALKSIPSVQTISTDVEGRIITVFCTTTDQKVKTLDAFNALNYGDSVVKNSALRREYIFEVTGMSCANCAMRVERTLIMLPGIALEENSNNTNVSVSSMTNKARVLIDESALDAVGPRGIIDNITKIGYGCTLLSIDGVSISSGESTTESDTLAEWYTPLLVSIMLGVPVMVLHLSMSFSETVMMYFDVPVMCSGGITLMQGIMFFLNLPILCIVGYRYYKGAVLGAMHNTYGMDCLVTVGTSITFLYSVVQLGLACNNHIATSHVFFETTGMLLMFVTIGKFIEAYAKRRSFAAISNLLKLQPREALLVVQSDIDYHKEGTDTFSTTKPSTTTSNTNTNTIPSTTTTSSTTNNNLNNNTTEITKLISLDLVQRGDVLKVFPGDRIPTDAYILMGSSFVDESMITGESLPMLKKKGDVLFGSTVNQNNVLYISVTSLGSESALYQIIKLVEAAQMSKAPVQAYADRIAGIFTPIILILSVLTFTVWCSLSLTHVVPKYWYMEDQNDPFLFSMIFAISVVVISCPCALGLATPTAIMAGTSVGAMNGILIKGGGAFETAHKIDTVIFDKTGTLTEGKPAVTDIVVFAAPKRKGSLSPAHLITTTAGSTLTEGTDAHALELENNLLILAATAEQSSDHPLSRAILQAAKDRHLQLYALREDATVMFVGSGVQCDAGVHGTVLVGNRALMEEQQVALSPQLDATMWDLQIQGKTAICVAVNQVIVGVLGLADTAKEEAYSTIRALHALKIDVWMVTGDNRTTAEALAEELEIPKDRILAGVLPKDKVAKVQELQTQGKYVAMVGDGINDSPALAQAHLGIAIGAGTEVAIEAADMVLIRSHLHDLVVALDLARLVFSRIQVNFIWATIYNILAIPYAAGCWFPFTHIVLPPQYAGLAMALSSVSVVISSMCLWLYRRPLYLVDENALQDKMQGGVLARARRKLQILKDKLTGGSHAHNKESGIAMNVLHSTHTSATSLNTMSSAGSGGGNATYKRLASTEMEANVDEFTSPGKTMEESLEEVLNATDANLASLERKKRASQAAPPITRSQYIEAKRLLTPDLYQTSTRPRPTSAPRGANLSYGRVVAFEDEGNFEQKSEDSIDRRFDAFLRKQRLMEDRLKKLEIQKNTEAQAAEQLREENVKLQEDQKLDHKLIHSLKSQLSSLKTKVDLIVSNEEQREAKMIHTEHNIHAHITHALKNPQDSHHVELSHQIAEIVRVQVAKALESQKQNVLNASINTQNNTLNNSQMFARSVNVDQVTSLEKEVIRLSAENDRTKQRMSVLDAAYNELKNTTTIREMKNEEHSKKVINSYRVEVETFLSSAARRTADALTSIHANTLDITALRSDLDNFIDRTGTVLAELDTKLTQHESSIEEIYTVLERVEHGIHTLKHTSQDHDNNILRFVEDSVLLAKLNGAVESHTRTLTLHNERFEHLDIQVTANTSAIESHSVPIDILAKSIDSINDKFEARTDTLHSTITANQEATSATLHTIQDTHKRTRGKVRELTESMKTISTIRTSIESVLQEVDARAKQDASWTYTFKTGLQRLENRLTYVEKTINPAGLPHPSVVDSSGDISVVGDKGTVQSAVTNVNTVSLHTTQFDELRALIADLRGELLHAQREENEALKDSLKGLLEQQITQLEDRCQQLVDEVRQHAEEYTEAQLQSSLDYVHNSLDTLHSGLSDVHALFDGLSHDVDALGNSLREQVTGVDEEVTVLKENMLVVEDRVGSVSTACENGLNVLQGQVSSLLDLSERVGKLESICNSSGGEDGVSLMSLSAQVVTLQGELSTLSQTTSDHQDSLDTLHTTLDNHCTNLTERMEDCDVAMDKLATRVTENYESVQDEVSTLTENLNDIFAQLRRMKERESALLAPVLEEIGVLKEDLSSHISFTNNCIADLQTALEESTETGKAVMSQQLDEVKEALQRELQTVQAELGTRISSVVDQHNQQLQEVNNDLQQYDASLRTALLDQHAAHSAATTTLNTTVVELNTALNNQDAAHKSKIGALEKRLAAQEGSVRERIVGLEVKLSTVEDSLRSHIASMAGTLQSQTLQLATQSEQLQQSIPLSTKEQLDQQLAATLTNNITNTLTDLLTESCDKLKAQIIVLRERLEETDSKVTGQESALDTTVNALSARFDTLNTQLTSYVDTSLAATHTAQETALTALTNDLLSTVDDRNNSLRELVYQLHELVGTHQDEYVTTINAITAQLEKLETSITSTDHLLSEHVNDSAVRYDALQESLNAKCSASDVEPLVTPLVTALVTPQLAQLQDTVTSEVAHTNSTVTALSNTINTVETDLVRRCNHIEHTHSNTINSVNDHFAELETRCDVFENDTTRTIDTINTSITTLSGELKECQDASTSQLNALQDALQSKMTGVEESLTTKNNDHALLLQLYEKRLRTVEKAIDTRVQELHQHNNDAQTQLQARINELSSGIERGSKENKECVNSLTLQLLSIQNQLNDHTDEVRTQIENEIVLLRDQLNTELNNRLVNSSGSEEGQREAESTRLEEWISRLQASHEDHLGMFETTHQAYEERFQGIESDLSGLDASVNVLQHTTVEASSAHNSTLLELHNEFTDFYNHSKARLTSIEQRAIRSDAANKEKVTELSNTLLDSVNSTHTTLTHTQTQLSQLKSELSSQQALLTSLESNNNNVTQIVGRMDEIEQKIAQYSNDASDKIATIEAYIHEQVEAVQGRTVPSNRGGAAKAPKTETSNTQNHVESAADSTAAADLSHISRVTLSPIRKRSHSHTVDLNNPVRSSTSSDVLNQTVVLTLHDQEQDDVLLGSRELYGTTSGGVDLAYESENDDDDVGVREDDEQTNAVLENDDNGGESLQQFNSMIETVNFDIATLGVHLKSFQADDQESATRRAVQEYQAEQARERQDLERQAAVENLQLKKFNHRRKFQRALFENKDA